MTLATNLLREAVEDIEYLRKQNELMAAKLEGVEIMAMAVGSERPRRQGTPMKECIIQKIKQFLVSEDVKA